MEKEKLIGSRLLDGREQHLGTLVVYAGTAYYFNSQLPDVIDSYRKATKSWIYAREAMQDKERKGTEGMVATKKTIEAYVAEEIAALDSPELAAKLQSKQYKDEKAFIEEVNRIYDENETLLRETDRVLFQLEGMIFHFFNSGRQLGKKLGGEDHDNIVDKITEIYGKYIYQPLGQEDKSLTEEEIVQAAIERNEKLEALFNTNLEHQRAFQKADDTIEGAMEYLQDFESRTLLENLILANQYENMINNLDRSYLLEDALHDFREDIDGVTMEDLAALKKEVDAHGLSTDYTQVVTEPVTDVPYKTKTEYALDFGFNPFVFAAGAVLIWKGLTVVGLPFKAVDTIINKTINFPLKHGLNSLNYLGNSIAGKNKKKELNMEKDAESLEEGVTND